jgi:hypothetical protein
MKYISFDIFSIIIIIDHIFILSDPERYILSEIRIIGIIMIDSIFTSDPFWISSFKSVSPHDDNIYFLYY